MKDCPEILVIERIAHLQAGTMAPATSEARLCYADQLAGRIEEHLRQRRLRPSTCSINLYHLLAAEGLLSHLQDTLHHLERDAQTP